MEAIECYWMEASDRPRINAAVAGAKLIATTLLTGLALERLSPLCYLLVPISMLELLDLEANRQGPPMSYFKRLKDTACDRARIVPLLRGVQCMVILALAKEIAVGTLTSYWRAGAGAVALSLCLASPSLSAWRARREAYLEKDRGLLLFGKWMGVFPRTP